jgi:hypothetical protein
VSEEKSNSKTCQTGCCPTPAATGSASCPGNMKLALDPVQSDFLALNIKTHEEKPYNVHELPSVDGKCHSHHLNTMVEIHQL